MNFLILIISICIMFFYNLSAHAEIQSIEEPKEVNSIQLDPLNTLAQAVPIQSPSSPSPKNALDFVNYLNMNEYGFMISGLLRSRIETWDYFIPPDGAIGRDNNYTFNGNLFRVKLSYLSKHTESAVEVAVPSLIGLPHDATALPPAGFLGQGAIYRGINSDNWASIFLKQAYFQYKGLPGDHTKIKVGRFEFGDGGEVQVKDKTLEWLKKNRINERLIGTFGFTHIGRSFDGFETKFDNDNLNATVFGAFPTQGVFDLQGHKDIPKVRVLYSGLTKKDKTEKSEGRLFYIFYNDARKYTIKTDNRPLTTRLGDGNDISIHTLGGHYIRKIGPVDFLSWGALQGGDWGRQKHRAYAWNTELGYQPKIPFKPWLRIGHFSGSGDDDPTDDIHHSFFEILPTPRAYARIPFYNLMNINDNFIQLVLRPFTKLTTRLDLHSLSLYKNSDLLYFGGGAFRNDNFGYGGIPSGGNNNLANFFDISLDYEVVKNLNLTFYFGHVIGKQVIKATFPGRRANYFYWEVTKKF